MAATERMKLGARAEGIAVLWLTLHGYRIIERNCRFRCGELDIVAEKDGGLVFVEVRSATGDYLSSPALTVTQVKQRKLIRAAASYLQRNRRDRRRPVRFDVMAVKLKPMPVVRWFKDAFRAGESWGGPGR